MSENQRVFFFKQIGSEHPIDLLDLPWLVLVVWLIYSQSVVEYCHKFPSQLELVRDCHSHIHVLPGNFDCHSSMHQMLLKQLDWPEFDVKLR